MYDFVRTRESIANIICSNFFDRENIGFSSEQTEGGGVLYDWTITTKKFDFQQIVKERLDLRNYTRSMTIEILPEELKVNGLTLLKKDDPDEIIKPVLNNIQSVLEDMVKLYC